MSVDWYAFGSKFLGAYCLECSAPPDLLCFENGSINTAGREMRIGETDVPVGDFIAEVKLRENNNGGSKHAIAVQLVAEIKAYRWDEETNPEERRPRLTGLSADSREVREFFITLAAQAKAATKHLR